MISGLCYYRWTRRGRVYAWIRYAGGRLYLLRHDTDKHRGFYQTSAMPRDKGIERVGLEEVPYAIRNATIGHTSAVISPPSRN